MDENKLKKESLDLHKKYQGKIETRNKFKVDTLEELSKVYSPGVAEPCKVIADDPGKAYELTTKGSTVAVVSDGSAVLGLGNIGPTAAIPVMEGKVMLLKELAGLNGFPICLATQDVDEIVNAVRWISPVFGGIILEDISAPRCFEVEARLQHCGIPIMHDDQHGTAIVVLSGILNASKLVNKPLHTLKVVINGDGSAGVAIAKILKCLKLGVESCNPVKEILICNKEGIISKDRDDLTKVHKELLEFTNPENRSGDLREALKGADVFIGVSVGGLLKADDIQKMNKDAIIFALANPEPEIMPDEALKGGAAVVATGRSDFPNQVNNVLAFPGLFKGALETRRKRITEKMKLMAAIAIASCIDDVTKDSIIPSPLDKRVVDKVANAIKEISDE